MRAGRAIGWVAVHHVCEARALFLVLQFSLPSLTTSELTIRTPPRACPTTHTLSPTQTGPSTPRPSITTARLPLSGVRWVKPRSSLTCVWVLVVVKVNSAKVDGFGLRGVNLKDLAANYVCLTDCVDWDWIGP